MKIKNQVLFVLVVATGLVTMCACAAQEATIEDLTRTLSSMIKTITGVQLTQSEIIDGFLAVRKKFTEGETFKACVNTVKSVPTDDLVTTFFKGIEALPDTKPTADEAENVADVLKANARFICKFMTF